MKILILHNSYQQRGGEDVAVETEAALLRAAGHDAECHIVSNEVISGPVAKVRTLLRTAHDPSRIAWVEALASKFRPDIVHIHNFFPLLTPAAHVGAARSGAAVVQTLHNYRLLCAGAMFLRDGKVCEKCLSGSRAWGIAHGCYRDSRIASAAIVHMQLRAESSGVWRRDVDRFIALTEFARSKFVAGGIPAERIAVKANTVAAPPVTPGDRAGALFVGRLSVEKGVRDLVEAWRTLPHIPLTIVGDGPERQRLEAAAPRNVRFLGRQDGAQVADLMRRTSALVIPSIWYEGFPMTVVEAFAAGTPVFASDIGSLSEIVAQDRTGALFRPGDPSALAACLRAAFASPAELARMGISARAEYEARYAPEVSLRALEAIYADAIAVRRARAP